MRENWDKLLISESFEIIGGGTPKTKIQDYWNGEIPWLSVVDFNNDQRLVHDTEKTITQLGLKNSSTKLLKKGDIIISARGTVGQLAQLSRPMAFNQSCYGLQAKENLLDDIFAYYLLRNSINELRSKSYGSVFDTITKSTFENTSVLFPPFPEQKAIASILSALDDKIELNLQMNKTLEEMAMALYKHWFVDFGPFQDGKFVDSELGMIPEGWEVKNIKDLLKIKPRNGLYKKKEFQGKGSRWLKMKSVYGYDFILDQDMELITVSEHEKENFGCLYNDLVFGRTSLVLEGIGKCSIVKSKIDIPIFESNLFRFRPDENLVKSNILFYFFRSNQGREKVKKLARQTAAVSITSADIANISIPIPNIEVQNRVNFKLDSFISLILENLNENQVLIELRDTLLPKLISGEVRLKEFQETIEQVL